MTSILQQLKKLEQDSISRGIPIVGSLKGKWLLEQVQQAQPKKILELGTANGYSGCILGSEGAELTSIDINAKIAEEAMIHFGEFGIPAQIILGDGVEIVREMAERKKEIFDMVFIDFYKEGYLKVLEPCLTLVKKGGLIIADNITFEGCQDFKAAVLRHPQLKTAIIDIGDGLSWSVKR